MPLVRNRFCYRSVIYVYIALFLFYYIYYILVGYREHIPNYMLFLQGFYFVIYTSSLIVTSHKNFSLKLLAVFVFFYSLLAGVLIRWISWHFLNEPFLGGADSVGYDMQGFVGITREFSYGQYISYLNQNDTNIDDLGMPSIVFWVYSLFSTGKSGQNAMVVLNAMVIACSVFPLNGILRQVRIERPMRRFCTTVYCCFPFLSLTAAVGLKENFFVFIILNSVYYLLRYGETRKIRHIFLAILFIIGSLFFRLAILAILLISGIVALIARESNKKVFLTFILFGIIGGALSISLVIGILYGKDLEAVLAVTEYRSGASTESVGSTVTWVVSMLAVLFGPYANFAHMSEYAIVHSSGVLFKGVLGCPLLIGLWTTIRHLSWRYYPLTVYFLLHTIMVVLAGVSLDMRYQITMFPLSLPFIAKSLQEQKISRTFFLIYIIVLFGLTWFYNKR